MKKLFHKIYLFVKKNFWRADWNIFVIEGKAGQLIEGSIAVGKSSALFKPDRNVFRADPFLFSYQGSSYLFYEEYEYDRGKGRICFAKLEKNSAGDYRPVEQGVALDLPAHLSYPNIFSHQGEIYMIPEMAEANEVALFRAVEFPSKWEKKATLVDNIPAIDPTLLEHDGTFWLFCAKNEGNPNNNLQLFFSDNLFGPWKSHPSNPVKTGMKGSRPAGKIIRYKGELYRLSQDCVESYGKSILIQQIQEISKMKYEETVVGKLEPKIFVDKIDGTHTANEDGEIVALDVKKISGLRIYLDRIVHRLRVKFEI